MLWLCYDRSMPTISLETTIQARPAQCFDLALSVDLHQHSMAQTRERAVAGVTSGHMTLEDTVTWEAVHFGIRQHLTSKITELEYPSRFVDEQVQGIFHSLRHVHEFFPLADGSTLMRDIFVFRAPLGLLGKLAEVLFLTHYMRRLLLRRNAYLKQIAESTISAHQLRIGEDEMP
jgi:ligand-binding SRPBCC domain-containing protein